MNLLPYFIARVGGISFTALEELNVGNISLLLDKLFNIEKQYVECRTPLCDELHELIAMQIDSKLQNKLLNLKRAIFNGKPIKEEDVSSLQEVFTPTLLKQSQHYLELQEAITKLTEEAQIAFNQALPKVRDHLKSLTINENLQKGLLLSSQALLDNLKSYREAKSDGLRKKELKTEESLIKYLTRMGAKTSPFSTFTNLSLGKISKEHTDQLLQSESTPITTSHICLNNYLYEYLRGLLLKLPDMYRCFLIRPNPTIRIEEEAFVFLTNSNNTEAFQRIPHNAVVELFYELVKDKPQGIRYSELIKDIIDNEYFDATLEELDGYINQLIGYGFLEYNIGVSGIDPFWDQKLVSVLSTIEESAPVANKIIHTLKEVRALAKDYADSGVDERRKIVKSAYNSYRTMCMELHEAAGLPAEERKSMEELQQEAIKKRAEQKKSLTAESEKQNVETETLTEEKTPDEEEKAFIHRSNTFFHFKPEQIFYEDATTSILPQLNSTDVNKILDDLRTLLFSMADFEAYLEDHEKMVVYFSSKYAPDSPVDVMRFYEDFFRDVKKPEAERLQKIKEQARKQLEKDQKKNVEEQTVEVEEKQSEIPPAPALPPTTLQRTQENKQWLEDFAKNIRELNKDSFHIPLSEKQLRAASSKNRGQYHSSYGAFMQFYKDEDGKTKAVVNGTFTGFGKMHSRFLHILDESLTKELRHHNAPKNDNYLCIENCDASFFNANLHPPLMPHEIWMPGGQNMLPGEQQIPITDLCIKYNEQKGKLVLIHKPSGKESFVFDLGFQGAKGRSPLFQLLSRFSLSEHLFYSSLTGAINNTYRGKEPIEKISEPIHYPRIIFNEQLVLQRRGWIIKKELLPKFQPTSTEWDFYKEINKWRKQLNMPDEVFVFMTSQAEQETLPREQMQKIGRDGYKPQYINFNNPLLINLLEKMISKVPIAMRIEEMLPNSSQMLGVEKQKWVSEFVMQWYE